MLITGTITLIESLRGCSIVVLFTDKRLSSSHFTKLIAIGSHGVALGIWLQLILTLILLVDTLTRAIYSLLVSVIWVETIATTATTRKGSSDSTKLLVLLYEVI